jgi:hypothetical protein
MKWIINYEEPTKAQLEEYRKKQKKFNEYRDELISIYNSLTDDKKEEILNAIHDTQCAKNNDFDTDTELRKYEIERIVKSLPHFLHKHSNLLKAIATIIV